MPLFPIYLLRDNTVLTISPAIPEILKMLSFQEKSMAQASGPKKEKIRLFEIVKDGPLGPVAMTYHGLWKRVKEFAESLGYRVEVQDHRPPFPRMHLERMFGFRGTQRQWLISGLRHDESGLIGAPTRYGKTTGILNTIRACDEELPIVVTAPGKDLIKQLADDVISAFSHRRPKLLKGKPVASNLIICSLDSLHHCDRTRTQLVIIDEPHATAASSRIPQIKEFANARKIGFGASLSGRYDQRDLVIEGLIGPILTNKTYREGVAEGMICPISVIHVDLVFDPWNCEDRNTVMNYLLYQSPRVAKVAKFISDSLPEKWQTLMFIKNEKQAEFFHGQMQDARVPIAMAKRLTTVGRRELTEAVKQSEVNRAFCSDIWVQGVTFSNLRVLMNLSGGGPYTSVIQKPGRLAEIRPELNKRRGILVDVTMRPSWNPKSREMPGQAWRGIVHEGQSRIQAYETIGYDMFKVQTFAQLAAQLQEFIHE